MEAVIETRRLSRHYGMIRALDDLSLTLPAGGIIGLVGKNGAGKTTFLSLLSGALKQSHGFINVLGRSPSSPDIQGKVGVLLQEANFKKGVPVLSQLVHFARLQGKNKMEAVNEINSLLGALNDIEFASQKPETLSYGQRKRLAILQAFIGNPALIILDEPTAGLDPVLANDIRLFIKTRSPSTTTIISSHNLYEIQEICTRVVILDKGKLLANRLISELARAKARLSFTLDKPLSAQLRARLTRLVGIKELLCDEVDAGQITLLLDPEQVDDVQIQAQALFNEQGCRILQMHRGQRALEGLLALIAKDR